jgi:rhamnosyltransferase subunit B
MRKIILTTIGTLGDLHPIIAIALALRRLGFRPVMAVAEDQVAKCRKAGLEAVPVLPGFDAVRRRMGLSEDEAVKRLLGNQREMLDQVLLPALPSSTEALETVCQDAEAIITSSFVFGASIVAEKHDIPLVSLVLQPMAMLSAFDPPCTPDFRMMKRAPVSRVGRTWNRFVYNSMRAAIHCVYSRRIDRVRAKHGLGPKGAMRLLEADNQSLLTLGTYSPRFGGMQPDMAENVRITGFPMFDSCTGAAEKLHPTIAKFLADGPAPIVFTLGSFAVNCAGSFYDEAAAAAKLLGRRAILLTGGTGDPVVTDDILQCGYAPHSLLFPAASAIVHHGGAGTTGQALRAGKPQMIVPHMGDQHDHGERIERMGLGLTMRSNKFTARRAAERISRLFDDPSYGIEAVRIGKLVARERGAETAARAIADALDRQRGYFTPYLRESAVA